MEFKDLYQLYGIMLVLIFITFQNRGKGMIYWYKDNRGSRKFIFPKIRGGQERSFCIFYCQLFQHLGIW